MAQTKLNQAIISQLSTDKIQEEVYDLDFALGASFGLRISKTGLKVFFLIYSINGRRKRMTLGIYPLIDLAQARELAQQVLRDVAQGRDPAAEHRAKRKTPTFERVCREFIAAREEHLSANTRREYQRIISRELLPLWGDRRISDINSADITGLLGLVAEGRGRLVLANRIRALLQVVFRFSASRGYLTEMPTLQIPRYEMEHRAPRRLNLSELQRLWQILDVLPQHKALALRLLLLTGQRVGDVLRMKWTDLSLDNWVIGNPRKAVPNEGKAGLRENRRRSQKRPAHLIPLVPPLFHLLKSYNSSKSFFPDSLVFASSKGAPRDLRATCKQLEKIEPTLSHLNPNSLRASVHQQFRALGAAPDILAYLARRQSALMRLEPGHEMPPKHYLVECSRILALWAQTLISDAPKPGQKAPSKNKASDLSGKGKVITLIPRKNL